MTHTFLSNKKFQIKNILFNGFLRLLHFYATVQSSVQSQETSVFIYHKTNFENLLKFHFNFLALDYILKIITWMLLNWYLKLLLLCFLWTYSPQSYKIALLIQARFTLHRNSFLKDLLRQGNDQNKRRKVWLL